MGESFEAVFDFEAVPLRPDSSAGRVVDLADAIDRFTRRLAGGWPVLVGEEPRDDGVIR